MIANDAAVFLSFAALGNVGVCQSTWTNVVFKEAAQN